MSGGGESTGSIGRGNSGGVGCSIMPGRVHDADQSAIGRGSRPQTSNPIARMSSSALLRSTTPGRIV
jgi:hypothetical protein